MSVGADRTLHELLESVAAPTPAPGAGTTSGWVAALAAGLVEMCARLTLSRAELADVHPRAHEVHARSEALRGDALVLAEQEMHSYEPVLEALRLSRSDPGRDAAVGRALSDATETPLAIARLAAEVAELAAELARDGNPNVAGDAAAGGELAAAACSSAARLIRINLRGAPGDPRLAEASALAARAAAARASLDHPPS
jgi:methenyltetrahydrofolate cyclohydrolase